VIVKFIFPKFFNKCVITTTKKTIDIKFSEHCFLNTMEQINVVVTYHVYVAHIEYINFSLNYFNKNTSNIICKEKKENHAYLEILKYQ